MESVGAITFVDNNLIILRLVTSFTDRSVFRVTRIKGRTKLVSLTHKQPHPRPSFRQLKETKSDKLCKTKRNAKVCKYRVLLRLTNIQYLTLFFKTHDVSLLLSSGKIHDLSYLLRCVHWNELFYFSLLSFLPLCLPQTDTSSIRTRFNNFFILPDDTNAVGFKNKTGNVRVM
jgi:hypothetical protein